MRTWELNEVIDKITNGEDGHVFLGFEDCVMLQKALINRGYATMMTTGELEGDYRLSWVYAGDVGKLNYADHNHIVFSSSDWIDTLLSDFTITSNESYDDEINEL